MKQWLLNVARLSFKELRSLLGDVPLVALILFAFTISVYTTAKGVKAEVSHASVGWIDADQLRELARPLAKNGYGQYLLGLLEHGRVD